MHFVLMQCRKEGASGLVGNGFTSFTFQVTQTQLFGRLGHFCGMPSIAGMWCCILSPSCRNVGNFRTSQRVGPRHHLVSVLASLARVGLRKRPIEHQDCLPRSLDAIDNPPRDASVPFPPTQAFVDHCLSTGSAWSVFSQVRARLYSLIHQHFQVQQDKQTNTSSSILEITGTYSNGIYTSWKR